MFYCPTHSTRIVKTGNAWFTENGETSESSRNVEIKKVRVQVPLTSIFTSRIIVLHVDEPHNNQKEQINDVEVKNEPIVEQPQEIILRRSQRERKYAVLDYYVVYLQESANDLSIDNCQQPISSG